MTDENATRPDLVDPVRAVLPEADEVRAAPDPADIRKDRREHGGMPLRPDDDELAARTEAERVDAGLEDYAPDLVPPATEEEPTDTAG